MTTILSRLCPLIQASQTMASMCLICRQCHSTSHFNPSEILVFDIQSVPSILVRHCALWDIELINLQSLIVIQSPSVLVDYCTSQDIEPINLQSLIVIQSLGTKVARFQQFKINLVSCPTQLSIFHLNRQIRMNGATILKIYKKSDLLQM